jgi:hypothetical protein
MRLRRSRVDEYASLHKYVKKNIVGGDALFLPALSFLFLLGLIRYLPKTDSIEYLEPHETV